MSNLLSAIDDANVLFVVCETNEFVGVDNNDKDEFAFKLLYEIVNKRPDLNLILFDNNSLNVGKDISKFKINKGADLDKYLINEKIKIIITSLIHQNSIMQNINKIMTEKNITQVEIIELK